MPYLAVGKCVYKKNPDGSKGKKVGCTKGSVKDYLAALHRHADKKKKKFARKVDRKMHSAGEIDYEKKRIRINPKKGDVVNTIYHEEVHRQYPNWSEKRVRKEAKKRETYASLKQIAKKLLKYAKR